MQTRTSAKAHKGCCMINISISLCSFFKLFSFFWCPFFAGHQGGFTTGTKAGICSYIFSKFFLLFPLFATHPRPDYPRPTSKMCPRVVRAGMRGCITKKKNFDLRRRSYVSENLICVSIYSM